MPGGAHQREADAPSGTSIFERRTIVESYRLQWTKAGRDGRQESAVSYSASAAEDYKTLKEAQEGVSDVAIVKVKPGM
ncbi:hypothetical protein GCM10010272_67650 [Streptomyces lateritius]|nr:hypothetical protein GCM10010272_67650 [Streptomyces lateritius]